MNKEFKECVMMLSSVAGQHKLLYLMDLSKKVKGLSKSDKNENTKIFGCMSVSYVKTYINNDIVEVQIDSESVFVKGLLYVLQLYINGQAPEDVLRINEVQLMKDIGLRNAITSQRTNGFYAALTKIKEDVYGNKNTLPQEEK